MLKRATLLVAVVLTIPSPQAALSGSSPPGPLEPPEGALFGAWVQPLTGWNRSDVEATIDGFEDRLGRSLGIDHHFYPRGSPYPTWQEAWDITNGRVPMITAGAVSTKKVNSGALDAALHARAAGVRDLGHPVFLRWFAEMDGDFQRRLTRSPSSYIRAWRRARWIFAREGAWNAVWVWCPTAYGFETGEAERYYPGDEYVDWICADGYNWAPARPGATWRGFREIYDAFYDFGMARGRPMMVGEYGCLERHPGEKAAWIADAQAVLKETFPNIGAVVYFNSKGGEYDWRVETSDSALQAFQAMGADLYFNPILESLGDVDSHRFDAILADVEPPEIHFAGRPRLRAGHPASLRWISIEPNADFVRLRYVRTGQAPRLIRRRSEDDGRFRWRVPSELKDKKLRILIAAADLAGNTANAQSGWVHVR